MPPQQRRPYFSQIDLFLICILIIGCTLRIVGIGVGLPDYPDPREPLIAQDILNLIHLEALPTIFNWPGTAWFYSVALIGKILETFGLSLTIPRVIWLARFTNVLLSTGTIWLTYQIGCRGYSRLVGRIAAGFVAVTMLHATNESRFALVDIPATFCVTLLLLLCVRDARAIWLGIVAGIGFAVKFTTAFVGLSVVVCLVRLLRKQHLRPSKLATVIGVAFVTFTVLCTYWLVDLFSSEWNGFFEAFLYEASHYRKGHFGLFATGEINWLNRFTHLWTLLRWGMGVPLALLSIVCLCVALAKRGHADKILLAFAIPYLLFVGWHKLKFGRHLLLIYPALTVLSAASMTKILEYKTRWWKQGIAIATLGVVGTYSLVYTAGFARIMTTPPTMALAAEWMETHIPPEDEIEVEPEILFDWLLPKLNRDYTHEEGQWVLVLMPNAEVFMKYTESPESYSPIDWYPIQPPELESVAVFYERVFQYELVKTFHRRPRFISERGAPFPMRALVHPEIRIYRLREEAGK